MITEDQKEIAFQDAVGQDSLNRFDTNKSLRPKRKPKIKFKKRKGNRDSRKAQNLKSNRDESHVNKK